MANSHTGYYNTTDIGEIAIDLYTEDLEGVQQVLHLGGNSVVIVDGDHPELIDNVAHLAGVEYRCHESH